jgi:hypothetical protein
MVGDERTALVEVGPRLRELGRLRRRVRRALVVLALRLRSLVETAGAVHLQGETHERVPLRLDHVFELRESDRLAALTDARVEYARDHRFVVLAAVHVPDAHLAHQPSERMDARRGRRGGVGEHRDQVEELRRVVQLACAERPPVAVGEVDVLLSANRRARREDLVPEVGIDIGEERLCGDRPDLVEELERRVALDELRPVREVREVLQLPLRSVRGEPRRDEERDVVVRARGDGVG